MEESNVIISTRSPIRIEPELIERCRRYDRAAQKEVYERSADRLLAVLLRIARDHADACDAAQEAFVKAFTRMEQFQGRSSFFTWLCRIAVNEALQLRRRAGQAEAGAHDLAGGPSLHAGDPSADRKMDVEQALGELPPLERAILVLRYQEGLDYKTISEITDCPLGTVGSRLNRARERMRERLRASYGSREENAGSPHLKKGMTGDPGRPVSGTLPSPRSPR